MSYFGNSVTEIYTPQEAYKPVIICVRCCLIPIYTLLLPFCASFMPRLANTGDIDIPNLWVISTGMQSICSLVKMHNKWLVLLKNIFYMFDQFRLLQKSWLMLVFHHYFVSIGLWLGTWSWRHLELLESCTKCKVTKHSRPDIWELSKSCVQCTKTIIQDC